MARLLCEAVNDEWPGTERRVVFDEVEALRSEIGGMEENQVIVVFYYKLGPVLEVLRESGAQVTDSIGDAAPRASVAEV